MIVVEYQDEALAEDERSMTVGGKNNGETHEIPNVRSPESEISTTFATRNNTSDWIDWLLAQDIYFLPALTAA